MGYIIFGVIWAILWLPMFPIQGLPSSWEGPLCFVSLINCIIAFISFLYGMGVRQKDFGI